MNQPREFVRLRLTEAEFRALPEYSRSLPTGQTPGKRWKSRYPKGWFVGEYDPAGPVNGRIGVNWYRPVILCARPEPEVTMQGKVSPGFDAALARARKNPYRPGRSRAGR